MTGRAGIYIHIPFCERKCFYCDFYSVADRNIEPEFFNALSREIAILSSGKGSYLKERGRYVFDSVYLGGGTPSFPHVDHMEKLLDEIRSGFAIAPGAEVTMEVNPGTVDLEKLRRYKGMGVNRLNIGIQSFSDSRLKFLKRIHKVDDALHSFEWARRAGFDNIGIDLIYGLPGQDKADLLNELERAVALEPEHISCYMLTYEEGTPLDKARLKGEVMPAEEGLVGEHYMTVLDFLESRGYLHYEISNFAKNEAVRSRHNMKYWDFSTYIGLGPSAHSYIDEDARRHWNISDINGYICRLKQGELPVEEVEILDREQQMVEALFLGLRKREGIPIDAFERRFKTGFMPLFHDLIEDLVAKGDVEMTGSHCRLTRKGVLLADGISGLFTNFIE